jgi:hypothetical protein
MEEETYMKRKYIVIAVGMRDEIFDNREDADGWANYLNNYFMVIADVFPYADK